MSVFSQDLLSAIDCADLYTLEDCLEQDKFTSATICTICDSDGRTLLHHAAEAGHETLCLYLTHHNNLTRPNATLLNKKDEHGATALDIAIRHKRSKAARILRELGGESDDSSLITDFIKATKAGNVEQMAQLVSVTGQSAPDQSSLSENADGWKESLLNVIDKRGRSALILAAAAGKMNAVSWLCSRGADKRYADPQGMTAHDYASKPSIKERLEQDEEVLQAQRHCNRLHEEFKDFARVESNQKGQVVWGVGDTGITIEPVANPHARPLILARKHLDEARSRHSSACNSPCNSQQQQHSSACNSPCNSPSPYVQIESPKSAVDEASGSGGSSEQM